VADKTFEMKRYYSFFVMVIFFALIIEGCGNSSNEGVANSKKDSSILSPIQQGNKTDDSQKCINTIKDFLAWYKVNFDSLKSIQLVDLIEDGSTAQYRVNFNNAKKYIEQMRLSGFFSDKYCQSKLQYFKEKDQELLKSKQSDGPPTGFEADLFLFTQEPNEVLSRRNSLKTEIVSSTVIKLISVDNNLLFNVTSQGDKCVIDDISFTHK
jgi:hypothetical protein